MDSQKQAYIYAIIVVLIWSTIASAFKVSLRYLDFLQLLFYSTAVSLIAIFIILICQNKLHLLKEFSKEDYVHSALLGFLNPFLYYVVLLKAYSVLTAQEAITLNYTWPIMIVILSIPLLGQNVGYKSILAISISFFGVFIIAAQGNILGFEFTNPFGAALAIGSAIIWALFWIFNTKDKRDTVAKLFVNFIFGFLYISIIMLLFSNFTTDISGLLGAAYVGLFEMGITFIFWSKALKLSKTTAKVSNFIYLIPFLSLYWVSIVVGEKILLSTIIGLTFIVAGIIIQQYTSAHARTSLNPPNQ